MSPRTVGRPAIRWGGDAAVEGDSEPSARLALTLAEWTVLGLLGSGTLHGFGVVKAAAATGELGQVWSVSRPLVYRAINTLRARGLIEPVGEERSDAGPPRTQLGITPAGNQQLLVWLRTPVAHVRAVRGPLLVKLAILARLHLDPSELLTAQVDYFTPLVAGLERRAADPGEGFEQTLNYWRLESAQSVMRFLARAGGLPSGRYPARDQLRLDIAIIGAGNIGRTLGTAWLNAGQQVRFGARDPARTHAQLSADGLEDTAQTTSVELAIDAADVVVLALPGTAVDQLLAEQATRLDRKIVVDAANRDPGGTGPTNSVAAIRASVPTARVIRAFNSLGWENFAYPIFNGGPADLFYCSDPDADDVARVLIEAVGLRPIRLGDVESVHLVDSVAAIWAALAFGQGRGRRLAFKVLEP